MVFRKKNKPIASEPVPQAPPQIVQPVPQPAPVAPVAAPIQPQPIVPVAPPQPQHIVDPIYSVEEMTTESAPFILNKNTNEQLSIHDALVKILNKLEEFE